jgi:hypothetical protein
MVRAPRTRPPCTEEFRREAVGWEQFGDQPQRQVAKDLGVSDVSLRVSRLYVWVAPAGWHGI